MEDAVQMPLWMVVLTVVVGPTAIYVYEKVWKPARDREVGREEEYEKKLQTALDNALKERDQLVNQKIVDLETESAEKDKHIEEIRQLHHACQKETRDQALEIVKLTMRQEMIEDRLRAAQERMQGMSSESAELRKLLVAYERGAPQ